MLNSKRGLDVLTGLAGTDTFVFDSLILSAETDEVTDFVGGTDTIALETAILAGQMAAALDSAAFVGNAIGLAADATDRITYNSTTGDLFFDADGPGGALGERFAALTDAPLWSSTAVDILQGVGTKPTTGGPAQQGRPFSVLVGGARMRGTYPWHRARGQKPYWIVTPAPRLPVWVTCASVPLPRWNRA